MKLLLDLHLHTKYSDGEKSPESLIKELKEKDVTHFSITDHDNIPPFEQIKRAALANDMHTLPGIEMSSLYKGLEVHVLGYRFDWDSPSLNFFIKERMALRKERALLIFKMLKKRGYRFSSSDIERVINAHYVGRPQIANLLFEYGYIEDPSEAFCEEFIGDSSSEVITHKLKPAEEVINIIKEAGGLVFLAHPGLFDSKRSFSTGMNHKDIQQFVTFGINGLEVFHPKHTRSQIQRYLYLAKKEKLLISIGSDFHRGTYNSIQFALNHSKFLKDVLSWLE